jgi:cobalt-zinc-cadmium efflux system outer membrane protein
MMIRCLCALLTATICAGTWAQAPAQVDLESAIGLALERSPRLAIERQTLETANAERQVAAARPNPTLSFGRQARSHPFSGTGAQQDLTLEWPIQIGGRREARIEVAERGLTLAQARITAAASQLVEEVGSAFFALLAAQERVLALDQAIDEVTRLAQIVSQRRDSGMASQYDVLRMTLESSAWRSRQIEAVAERTDRQARLASLMGLSEGQPRAQGALTPWTLDLGQPIDLARHPLLRALQDDRAMAQAHLELARRERLPALSVLLGRGWGADRPGGVGSAGVALEMPLLDTRIGLTHRAASELRSSILRGQAAETELSAELERQTALVRQRTAAFERHAQTVLPQLNTLRQMAEDAYRLGRGSLVDLLDATRVRHETQLDQLSQLASLLEAQWRLQALRGDLAGLLR